MFIKPEDLAPFATIEATKLAAMIEDAEAQACLAAPCLNDPSVTLPEWVFPAVKSILRGAIIRWDDSGSGAVQQQTAGPFSMMLDNRQKYRALFQPTEIEQLRAVCAKVTNQKPGAAWSVSMAPSSLPGHAPWCDLYFGGTVDSCGYDIAGFPLYENDGL